MSERAAKHPKIEILWSQVLEKVEGDSVVSGVILKRSEIRKENRHEAEAFSPSGTHLIRLLENQIGLHPMVISK